MLAELLSFHRKRALCLTLRPDRIGKIGIWRVADESTIQRTAHKLYMQASNKYKK